MLTSVLRQLLRCALPLAAGLHAAQGQDHLHMNAGAQSPVAGSPLAFPEAEAFVAGSGFAFTAQPAGPADYYAGYHATTDITFTALASTPFYGGPEAGHAASGAFLRLQVVSVSGPPGGSFGFWEWSNPGEPGSLPTATAPVGALEATPGAGLLAFDLTEVKAGPDPYGHIHGRAFTLTSAGRYDVLFRIIDTSGIHTPSSLVHLRFASPGSPLPAVSLLEKWRITHFSIVGSFGNAGDLIDPDGDGSVNLVEYATGSDPRTPSPPRTTLGIAAGRLTLAFDRIADPALTYVVEAAGHPGVPPPWDTIFSSTGPANTAGPVTVHDAVLVADHPRRVLRLRVEH